MAWRGVRGSKYAAKRQTIDGVNFASQREARRYVELKALQQAGEITNLMLQPCYRLFVQPFIAEPAEIVEVGKYFADFQYFDRAGRKVVEDSKGFKTETYRLKKKFVEALYGIQIHEV